jgi:hypothetical protein
VNVLDDTASRSTGAGSYLERMTSSPRVPSRPRGQQICKRNGWASQVARPTVQSLGLSDFFEPPPGPVVPAPQRYRTPPWFGAPRGTLPGVVAFERVLAQTDKVAVCVTRLAAYPTGFEFDVVTMTAADE